MEVEILAPYLNSNFLEILVDCLWREVVSQLIRKHQTGVEPISPSKTFPNLLLGLLPMENIEHERCQDNLSHLSVLR